MKDKHAPPFHPVPSIGAEHQDPPEEAAELTATEITIPVSTTLPVPQELLARDGSGYHASHWGINE